MASSASHTIRLKGTPQRQEKLAGGTITPGDLIERTASDAFIRHATAGGKARPLWAAENELFGGDIDDNYASGDNVLAWNTNRGDEIYARLAAGAAAVVIGDRLESAGDGTVRKSSSGSVSVATGTVTDDDSAASNGTAVYAHIDEKSEFGSNTAHLESVTAGNANSDFDIGLDGPTVRVNDDDAAATGGLQVYYDEDAANPDSRFLINNTLTGRDLFVISSTGQALRLVHNASAASVGVALYFDDDAVAEELRLLFVSPTNADGTYQTDDVVGQAIVTENDVAIAKEAVDNNAGGTAVRLRVESL